MAAPRRCRNESTRSRDHSILGNEDNSPRIGPIHWMVQIYNKLVSFFYFNIYIYIYIHTHTHTHTCRVQLELANKDAFMLEVQFSILGGGYIWHVE